MKKAFLVIVFLLLVTGCVTSTLYEEVAEHRYYGNFKEQLTGDIPLPLSFGWMVSQGRLSLVEFTVLSITQVEGTPQGWSGDYHYSLVLRIDDMAIEVDDTITEDSFLWPSAGDEINNIAHSSVVLEEGQRYLTFLSPNILDRRFVAKINEDRSITATIQLGFYLREYDGYTVEQLREIANEILVYGYTPAWEVGQSCLD